MSSQSLIVIKSIILLLIVVIIISGQSVSHLLQEHLAAFLEEERQRAREMMDRALQEARQERDVYVQQQRQVTCSIFVVDLKKNSLTVQIKRNLVHLQK